MGLLGGSFDPAHEGHLHVTREALKRFGLDAAWWLVSPGNPLKARGPAPLETRMAEARALVDGDPRITVTGIEARLGTRYTAETVAGLQRLYPRVRFTWLMGADNLAQFHLWDRWEEIMARVPVGVIARPGQRLSARMSKTAERFARHRLPAAASHLLPLADPPAWCFINIPMSHQSSTAIRAAREAAKK
ncbi:nicotinate-nucleotide adenylyltransferase [Vannielia litorea]|uniref:Probable nicotinate-nucleotide adenylyltransferase n=1 Tax=Vannielia litorea TaxID=1217970 RepID=A0A1N6DXQ8_9RHOB|nr:nicotinate-nucleotide adenylyltransferase [Vannielia litorea]